MKKISLAIAAMALMCCTNKPTSPDAAQEEPMALDDQSSSDELPPHIDDPYESDAISELLPSDTTHPETKYALDRSRLYVSMIKNIGHGDSNLIAHYQRSYEHSWEMASFTASDSYKVLFESDKVHESYENGEYYLFKNDTLVAQLTEHLTEQDGYGQRKGYNEIIRLHESGTTVIGTREADDEASSDKKIYLYQKYSPRYSPTLSDFFPLLARFDPRLPKQELLGEPSEEDLLLQAREDSIERLKHVDFANASLEKLPGPISVWANVTHVHLNGNKFTRFPEELKQIPGLMSLDLSNNKLSSIPREIMELESLEELYLDNNRLTSLPVEITSLKNLRYLSLAHNQFTREAQEKIMAMFSKTHCVVTFAVLDDNLQLK
jgi:hypothetical protein